MPERSKGAVSRTAIERCVGSNPTGCIFAWKNLFILQKETRTTRKQFNQDDDEAREKRDSVKNETIVLGNVAQMVERSFRIRKARGSIPLISILERKKERRK